LVLANIASKCSFDYGAMGTVGFLYESVKDSLKWNNLRPKFYTKLLMRVGELLVADEKTYKEFVVKNSEMSDDDIAKILKTAFLKD
jgi:hypothetical protein